MTAEKARRIILAVDIKSDEPDLIKRNWKALRPLLSDKDTVEPVTVLNREDSIIGNVLKGHIGSIQLAVERHLSDELARLKLNGLAPPKILFADGSSTQRAVTALLAYAKRSGADLIAISSHARNGFGRLLLGSFAETLSLQSRVPLLVVSPSSRFGNNLESILFPTDFSPESKEGLLVACSAFKAQKPKITLFYSFVPAAVRYGDPFFGTPLPQGTFDSWVKEELSSLQETGKQWRDELRRRGFRCDLIIDKRSIFVADGILAGARKARAGMIAMVSSTGNLAATLMGSTTRQVIRSSHVPVWVVHSPKKQNKRTPVRGLSLVSRESATA